MLGFTTATQPAIPYASSSFIEAQEAHQGKPAPIHTQLFTDEVKNSDAEPIDANEIAWIEVDEYTAEALLSAGVMEFIEIDEQGQAIYAMSSAPSVVIVVIQGTGGGPVPQKIPGIAPPQSPCPAGWVAGPGGTCINGGWQLYDYKGWVVTNCYKESLTGYVVCNYKFEFEFIRLTAGTNCNRLSSTPCTAPNVCVEFVSYTATCSRTNTNPEPGCELDCSCCPSTPYGPAQGGCATPNPSHPGVYPGAPLPGFTVVRDFKCYAPGAPW